MRPGSGLGFQIASIDAIPCVLWFVIRYASERPQQVLQRVIGLGGDTDTIASMAGAIVGALHGIKTHVVIKKDNNAAENNTAAAVDGCISGVDGAAGAINSGDNSGVNCGVDSDGWIAPHLIQELENGERGRDYAMQLAERLCDLDLSR